MLSNFGNWFWIRQTYIKLGSGISGEAIYNFNDASVASLNVTSLIFSDKQVGYLAGAAAARVSKTGKVVLLSNSTNLDLETGFTLGVNAAKKKVKLTIKSAATELADVTKTLIADGNDVVFVAVSGSVNEIFSAVVKYNETKKKKRCRSWSYYN